MITYEDLELVLSGFGDEMASHEEVAAYERVYEEFCNAPPPTMAKVVWTRASEPRKPGE